MDSAPKRRTIFFISDSTAITAETLGQSLLTQFEPLEFDQVTLPFVDTFSKAGRALMQINNDANTKGIRPIVFSTLINPDIRRLFKNSSCIFFDFFDTFISRLESELDMRSSHTIGRYHGLIDDSVYSVRIDAMNYAMGTDDGISTKDYDQAEVILLGVSRSGKTPTCLYLGLQFGIYAANYPLTEETLLKRHVTLPEALVPVYRLEFSLRRVDRVNVAARAEVAAATATPAWTFDAGAPCWPGVTAADAVVFAGCEDGQLHALEARSGIERW